MICVRWVAGSGREQLKMDVDGVQFGLCPSVDDYGLNVLYLRNWLTPGLDTLDVCRQESANLFNIRFFLLMEIKSN